MNAAENIRHAIIAAKRFNQDDDPVRIYLGHDLWDQFRYEQMRNMVVAPEWATQRRFYGLPITVGALGANRVITRSGRAFPIQHAPGGKPANSLPPEGR